jgi:hypothetical protein
MALGTHQALERLEQSRSSGATSFGPTRFDANGDVQAAYHVFGLADDGEPGDAGQAGALSAARPQRRRDLAGVSAGGTAATASQPGAPERRN